MAKIGDVFENYHADTMAEFVVIGDRGNDTWDCKITTPGYSGDFVYTTRAIDFAVRVYRNRVELAMDHDAYYASLKVGQIVHYYNGPNYVRCEVVAATQDDYGEPIEHGRALKPVALVGEWHDYDLPHRDADGSIVRPYHAKQVAEGKVMQPHFSNIWESPEFNRRNRADPTQMEPVDLAVPEMTDAEKHRAEMVNMLSRINDLTGRGPAPQQQLERIYMLVTSEKVKRFLRPEVVT